MKFDTIVATSKNKVIYRDGENCIKLFDELYSKSDVLNEALNHARMEETGLNIPKIHEVTLVDGRWAIILEYIEGKTLAQLMEENPEKKNEYIDQCLIIDEFVPQEISNPDQIADIIREVAKEESLEISKSNQGKFMKIIKADYNVNMKIVSRVFGEMAGFMKPIYVND